MITCRDCGEGVVRAFRLIKDGRRLWVCHECDSVWLGGVLPAGPSDGTLYLYVEPHGGPGTPTDWQQIEPLAE